MSRAAEKSDILGVGPHDAAGTVEAHLASLSTHVMGVDARVEDDVKVVRM